MEILQVVLEAAQHRLKAQISRVRGTVLVLEIHEVISKMEEMYTVDTLYNTNCTKSFYIYVHNFSILSFACFVPVH
jgi:hypothetical protein